MPLLFVKVLRFNFRWF